MKIVSITTLILGGFLSICADDARAGSNSKFDYREPNVVTQFLPETLREVAYAPTTLYAGITAQSSNVTADGSFSFSQGGLDSNQSSTLGLPSSQRSNRGFGFVLGLRNVTDSGFFMGGEVYVNPSSKTVSSMAQVAFNVPVGLDFESSSASYTQTAQLGREVGGRLLAGYQADKFRIFGGIGAGSSTAKVSIEQDSARAEHSRNMVGVNLSAGVEYDIIPNLSLRLEASTTRFGKLSYGATSKSTHSVDFSRRNIELGLMLRN